VTSRPTLTNPTHQDQAKTGVSHSMQEYYRLQEILLKYSLLLLGPIFLAVWFFYSINIALNYLLGAIVGILYLRMLFKDVEKVGAGQGRIGSKGLLIFSGLIIIACRWQQLHVIPVFLGFLTYKAAIIVYMFESLLPKKQKSKTT
jgi:ATP synthase protein I